MYSYVATDAPLALLRAIWMAAAGWLSACNFFAQGRWSSSTVLYSQVVQLHQIQLVNMYNPQRNHRLRDSRTSQPPATTASGMRQTRCRPGPPPPHRFCAQSAEAPEPPLLLLLLLWRELPLLLLQVQLSRVLQPSGPDLPPLPHPP